MGDRRGDVLVLCYHAVSRAWDDALAVTPAALEAQVAGLLRRGYVPATFAEALHAPPARRTVAVTFDDACVSVARDARPVLDRLGVPATVFVPTGWVGRPAPMRWAGIEHHADGPDADELRCLDWPALHDLVAAGWEIGSHTVAHPHLTRTDDGTLDAELRGSRAALEAGLGRRILSVAYPYGDEDPRVRACAAEAGYLAGAALPARPHADEPLRWGRVGVYRRDDRRRFRAKAAPSVRALRRRVGR